MLILLIFLYPCNNIMISFTSYNFRIFIRLDKSTYEFLLPIAKYIFDLKKYIS